MANVLTRENVVQTQRFDFLEVFNRISEASYCEGPLTVEQVAEAIDFFKDGMINKSDYSQFMNWYPGQTVVSYNSFTDFAKFARVQFGSQIPVVGAGMVIEVTRDGTAAETLVQGRRGNSGNAKSSTEQVRDHTPEERQEKQNLLTSLLDEQPDFFTDEHKRTIQELYDRVSPDQQDILVDFFENFQGTNEMDPAEFENYYEEYRDAFQMPLNFDLDTREIFWLSQNAEHRLKP